MALVQSVTKNPSHTAHRNHNLGRRVKEGINTEGNVFHALVHVKILRDTEGVARKMHSLATHPTRKSQPRRE